MCGLSLFWVSGRIAVRCFKELVCRVSLVCLLRGLCISNQWHPTTASLETVTGGRVFCVLRVFPEFMPHYQSNIIQRLILCRDHIFVCFDKYRSPCSLLMPRLFFFFLVAKAHSLLLAKFIVRKCAGRERCFSVTEHLTHIG